MEMIYSKELGLTVLPEARTVVADSFSFTDALALYHRLKRTGAAGGSVTLGSTQDPGDRLHPRLPQILQLSQVQCQLSKCSTEQMAEASGARWMCDPLLPAQLT